MRTKTSVFRLKQNTNNKKRTHPLEKMMDDYMGSPVVLDRSCVFVPFGGGYKFLGKTFSKHQENQNISINEIQKNTGKRNRPMGEDNGSAVLFVLLWFVCFCWFWAPKRKNMMEGSGMFRSALVSFLVFSRLSICFSCPILFFKASHVLLIWS